MPKKKSPATEAEDKMFANAPGHQKELLKQHRKLKRDKQRSEWKEANL